jgi:hypothetical protein
MNGNTLPRGTGICRVFCAKENLFLLRLLCSVPQFVDGEDRTAGFFSK